MVTEVIVLGHKIYAARLEVEQAKIVIIKTLLPPMIRGPVGVLINKIYNLIPHTSVEKLL